MTAREPLAAEGPLGKVRGATSRHPDVLVTACGGVLGVAAFALQLAGLEPIVLHALTMLVWLWVGTRRVGAMLATAATAVGWLSTVFVGFALAPVVGIDPRLTTSVLMMLILGAAPLAARAFPAQAAPSMDWRLLLAASSGGLLWLGGLAWGLLSATGGGWSWAMYRDSTMDLWEMRGMVQSGGLGPELGSANIQPLTHAVSASLVSPRASVAASPEVASAFLTGHGYHWTAVIVLSTLLAGLVAHRLAARADCSTVLPLVVAATVSLAGVLFPLTGVAFQLGQINVHSILVMVCASVGAALSARDRPPLAVAIVILAFGLLCATWIAFAAVPAFLMPVLLARWRGAGLNHAKVLGWTVPPLLVGTWAFVAYGWPLLLEAATEAPTREHLATQSTYAHGALWSAYTNPHSIELSATVALGAVALGVWLLSSRARYQGAVLLAATSALALGVVPTALTLGTFTEPLAYFPAKHLFIGTYALIPLLVGALAYLASRSRAALVTAASILTVLVTGLALTAQPSHSQRWSVVPWEVATGAYFGAHDEVAGRFIDYASSDELRLPWRLDPTHDGTVNLMMSSVGPDVDLLEFQSTRVTLRTYRNDFAPAVACELALAETRPLVLITRDPNLAAHLADECPHAGITVELTPARN